MPLNLRNAQLRTAADSLRAGAVDAKSIGTLVAALGTDGQSRAVLDGLKTGALPPDQMLQVAKAAIAKQPTAADDLKALLGDAQFTAKLDPASLNFLKAAVGLEPLKAGGAFGGAPIGQVADAGGNAAAGAIAKMRDWIKTGQLARYYEAAIGKTDNAAMKDEAMRVFNALPAMAADSTAVDFVKAGFWAAAPKGIDVMLKSARYLPGRQLLVPAKVDANVVSGNNNFMAWKDDGADGVTYRATLQGEKGDKFLVKIDGKADLVEIDKAEIFKLNQPQRYTGTKASLGYNQVDYNEPFTKAKIAEAALLMADDIGKLDFTKMKTQGNGGVVGAIFGGRGGEEMTAVQRRCVKFVHDAINMTYRSDPNDATRVGNGSIGRQAIRGHGVCTEQAGVMLAMLVPFRDAIGIDVQEVMGGVLRYVRDSNATARREGKPLPSDKDQLSKFSGGAHGWLQVTYRPKMETRIIDRTWRQPDTAMDVAYSVGGDRYPSPSRYRNNVVEVSPTDVNFSGDVSVQTYDRQFGVVGRDGRENHMSNDETR